MAPDCVVLTGRGVFHGHDDIRELARQLYDEIPSGVTDAEGRVLIRADGSRT